MTLSQVLISDTVGYGLLVCDMHILYCCRVESDYMKPTDINFNIENQTFILNDGILDETLIHEKLYYAPFSGDKIYKMKIPQQLECLLSNSEVDNITELAGILSGQTEPIASYDRVIFFSNIPETSILCTYTSKEINSDNSEIIAQDSEKLQFPSGMKVVYKFHQLMILTNRFQNVITDALNISETNFCVLSMNLEEIRNKTNCFVSCNKEEKHKKCSISPSKTRPKYGPPKGHKHKPRGGPAKVHNNKSFGEIFLKNNTDKTGSESRKDHKDNLGDGAPKHNTDKLEEKFFKDDTDKPGNKS